VSWAFARRQLPNLGSVIGWFGPGFKSWFVGPDLAFSPILGCPNLGLRAYPPTYRPIYRPIRAQVNSVYLPPVTFPAGDPLADSAELGPGNAREVTPVL